MLKSACNTQEQAGLQVHEFFFRHELLAALAMIHIVDAAVYRTNSGTLRFIVEANAFCALIGDDIIYIECFWCLGRFSIQVASGKCCNVAPKGSTITKTPFITAFVYGVVGTFGLTSPAINTFIGNFNRHDAQKFDTNLRYLCLITLKENLKFS